ncbi:hypothetical protein RND71_021020 [Anisodus tanguticus]|uniref:Response regulatory domain-containing protein n=1 Tax=Anisodus tanguticus TaxID=243964 RepID=A0AAE1RXJ5_9SOLA|nr:hypothetical protein RND71_021020 [Anisodus tanguticus]
MVSPVTTCNRAEVACSLIWENKNGLYLVIRDVHMADMDGFKLLEHIGLEMDLPVIRVVPKKILEQMNVPWLKRENVASHLQEEVNSDYDIFTRDLGLQNVESTFGASYHSSIQYENSSMKQSEQNVNAPIAEAVVSSGQEIRYLNTMVGPQVNLVTIFPEPFV